ncbi:hypothetical protein [Catellicoccus marimammalium]|uniref:Uncharacterized protein n=1 Tax=Catellicoccus marimammalium M35/04/3 TaxID=1234409 RepID=K8Z7Z4_9ENTE|nr:hypothetical protein [Catellicoccus marimammalium]EKU27104.1 hypothetical protein C683_1100 [Catellicoccus marimammalium M35/04/3]
MKNKLSTKKIIRINTILFFIGWLVILLLGSDFPPPIGFLWAIILIILSDFIQYKYLQYFIPQLRKKTKYLFSHNLLFFTMSSALLSLIILLLRYPTIHSLTWIENGIWILVFSILGGIYSILFYFFNKFLLYFIKKDNH